MADPDNAELFPSQDAAEQALTERVANWRRRGWKVIASEHEENRYTVSDDRGQFVGEFYLED